MAILGSLERISKILRPLARIAVQVRATEGRFELPGKAAGKPPPVTIGGNPPLGVVSVVVKITPRKPTAEEVMSIIDDASYWDGNATTNTIRFRLMLAYGWHTGPTAEQLRQVLHALLADDLIVRDAVRQDGGHYALTFKGKKKLARLREGRRAA